jgi:hypothetical protein
MVSMKAMEDISEEEITKKLYRAGAFAKSSIVCPSCFMKIEKVVDECPRCQFSGAVAVQRYPFPAPLMARFMDDKDIFDPTARQAISNRLTQLERQFPQVRICFCALELPEHVDLREFGYWLFNASPVENRAEADKRPWTILLLLDHALGRVSVTSGYAIEPFVSDDQWVNFLRLEREYFFKRDYREAGLRFVASAEKILREGANRAEMKMRGKMKRKKRVRSRREKEA